MADDPESACPVDHRTRDAWLAQARAVRPSNPRAAARCPVEEAAPSSSAGARSWTQTLTSYLPWSDSASSSSSKQFQPTSSHNSGYDEGLDTDRAVSSIPRFSPASADKPGASAAPCPVQHGASAKPAAAANHEIESGADAASGNWVYPSEKMFFDAMKRKGYDARVADMKTVVPIHNAVNERAWKEIQAWEAPYLEDSKYGPPFPSSPVHWTGSLRI